MLDNIWQLEIESYVGIFNLNFASHIVISLLPMLFGLNSVRAQAADYLKKKAIEMNPSPSLAHKEEQFSASTLFRDGIKKRNAQKLLDLRRINHITSEPDSNL